MKSSLCLVVASSLLASAGPMRKRDTVVEWVEEVVATITVTAGAGVAPPANTPIPSSSSRAGFVQPPKNTPVVPPVVAVPVLPGSSSSASKTPQNTPTPSLPISDVKVPAVSTSSSQNQTPTPSAPSSNLGGYQQTMIDSHTLHRQNHSVGALAWDDTLAQYATTIASRCVFQHDMTQGGGGYGQNLASKGTTGNIDDLKLQFAAQAVTNQWYNGEANNFGPYYGMANPPSSVPLGDYGHFTQLTWKSTQFVGCATVKCAAGTVLSTQSWYTVCNYRPAGNFVGRYGENVLKPIGMSVKVA